MMDCDKLVKALRYCAESGDFKCGKDCPMHTEYPNCLTKMDTDAAAAIEALQAQLPKRGEWINSKERMRPDMCSVCGCIYEADRFMDKIAWNYCPNCGAKMEVQDG